MSRPNAGELAREVADLLIVIVGIALAVGMAIGAHLMAERSGTAPHQSQPEPPATRPLEPCR